MSRTLAMIAVAALATSAIATPNAAYAGAMVTGDVMTNPPFVPLGKAGTTELRAFSQELNKTNQNFFGDLTSGGKVVNPAPNGAPLPLIQNISVQQPNGIQRYVPVIGLAGQPKANIKQANDIQTQFSVTGTYQGSGNQFQSPTGRFLAALAFTNSTAKKPPAGAAAGAAYDPILIPGGAMYSYSPMVDASFQLGDASETGGVDMYAVDSTVFTSDDVANFLNDGSPFNETLWHLNLAANGPVMDPSNVGVDFELNPLALKEIIFPISYLTSLPGYSMSLTDAQIALLIDAAVDDAASEALSLVGDTVQLQNFALFADGTLYAPTTSVEYAEGVDAGLTTVPEPPSLFLLASALLMLVGFRRAATCRSIGSTANCRKLCTLRQRCNDVRRNLLTHKYWNGRCVISQ